MYNHNLIESKWKKFWLDHRTFAFKDENQKKFYILDMFPYPSGSGLHVGHPKGYTATDIISRFKRLNGYDVLHPIGWDAFGLPAEQYALITGNHPENFTKNNIDHFRNQLQMLGFDYDYSKEINTTSPYYYQWTQWIFGKLFEHGLAEIKNVNVNWCEKLGTVLANEEVFNKNGELVSERGEYPVVKKPMSQWVLKITKYADKLLEGLDDLNWPESLKAIQRKWIGKSTGALIKFSCDKDLIEVFSTRPETIFGASFIAIAPEHEFAKAIKDESIQKHIRLALNKTDVERQDEKSEKIGIFTGKYAINPVNQKQLPIYIADYVLDNYGTGAIMGVPAYDQRDYEFAKKYHLEISKIFNDKNILINSDFLDGLEIKIAHEKIIEWLKKHNVGENHTTYKLKDWLFSRQRYWGEPFPIIFDENKKPHLVNHLPVLLPKTNNIKPSGNGKSPLDNLDDWKNLVINGKKYTRETNTMPQWAGSCWYYLAYLLKESNKEELIPLNSKKAFKIFEKWLPVDLYIGGQEHAVLHLLYARFWHRFLYDIKIVPTKEPFNQIINQGMILGPNGEKMSKSRGNMINPDDIIKTHGADALRIYEVFMGPINATMPWSETGLDGVRKWLDRVWNLFHSPSITIVDDLEENSLEYDYNIFLKEVTQAINSQHFNVAISKMMVFINACYKQTKISKIKMINFLIILSCFAPFIAQELYSIISKKDDQIAFLKWPVWDENKTIKSEILLPISLNGKFKFTIEININDSQDKIEKILSTNEKYLEILKNFKPKKIIYIKNKIFNIIC